MRGIKGERVEFGWNELEVIIGRGCGLTNEEIAEFADMSPGAIGDQFKRSPNWRLWVNRIRTARAHYEATRGRAVSRANFRERMEERFAGRALDVYEASLDGENPMVALAAAKDIKETLIGKAAQKIDHSYDGEVEVRHTLDAATQAVLEERLGMTPPALPPVPAVTVQPVANTGASYGGVLEAELADA